MLEYYAIAQLISVYIASILLNSGKKRVKNTWLWGY